MLISTSTHAQIERLLLSGLVGNTLDRGLDGLLLSVDARVSAQRCAALFHSLPPSHLLGLPLPSVSLPRILSAHLCMCACACVQLPWPIHTLSPRKHTSPSPHPSLLVSIPCLHTVKISPSLLPSLPV
jgi:hypothetical protein